MYDYSYNVNICWDKKKKAIAVIYEHIIGGVISTTKKYSRHLFWAS